MQLLQHDSLFKTLHLNRVSGPADIPAQKMRGHYTSYHISSPSPKVAASGNDWDLLHYFRKRVEDWCVRSRPGLQVAGSPRQIRLGTNSHGSKVKVVRPLKERGSAV